MHKIKNRTAPSSFLEKFEQPAHSYPTRFSSGNYRKPQIILRKCRFRISIRGLAIWNNLVGSTEKEIQSHSFFLMPLLLKKSHSVYICIWFYLLQCNCNNGYLSRTSFVHFLKVNEYILILIKLYIIEQDHCKPEQKQQVLCID